MTPAYANARCGASRFGKATRPAITRARQNLLLLVGRDGIEERVTLRPDILEQGELGLEEVDMTFLVLDQFLEQDLRGVVLDRFAMIARLDVEIAGVVLGREVGLERFLEVLADPQRIERLQVRMPLEEDDSLDQLVGVVHLLDAFLTRLLRDPAVAPVILETVMQPVLADCGQLAPQGAVQVVDDAWIAFHASLLSLVWNDSNPSRFLVNCRGVAEFRISLPEKKIQD